LSCSSAVRRRLILIHALLVEHVHPLVVAGLTGVLLVLHLLLHLVLGKGATASLGHVGCKGCAYQHGWVPVPG